MEGQLILTAQQLRQHFLPTQSVGKAEEQKEYYQLLAQKGLALNPKMCLSLFQLKNGLPFVGMAAKQLIAQGQVLVRVPEELILSSAKAVQQEELKEVFKHRFFTNEHWQDRGIIVYSMFLLYKKDEGNAWYQMIKNFPKQCDIICFWPKQELNTFKDLTVISAAEIDIKSFEQEWSQFEQCKKQHPILQQSQFSRQNYRNIFVNLTNRSFGKYLNYISLIPFAQFFNHHCSKIYYTVEKQKKNQFHDNIADDDQSSLGSYDSNDYIEQGQFAYDTVQVTPFNWEVEESYQLNDKEKDDVKSQALRIMKLLDHQLNWEDFTVLFVGHLLLKLKIIEKEYLVGRKPYQKTKAQFQIVQNCYDKYRNSIIHYYKTAKRKEYLPKQKKQVKSPENFNYPVYKKQYESVVLKTTKFDRIQANNQIFFKYGHISNRSLLLRYGFAIEGNKYEHVWVSFSIVQCFQDFPDVLDKVMEKKLSLLRKFKIHHHILNMDIILFFRLNSWVFYHEQAVNQIFNVVSIPKQIMILQQIVSILQDNLQVYQGQYDLTNKQLNYHQYFITVYHKEKYTILAKQIAMLNKIIHILNLINEGKSKEEAILALTTSQSKIMKYYIDSIQ